MFVNYIYDGLTQYGNAFELSVGNYGPSSQYQVDDGSLKDYIRDVKDWQITYQVEQTIPITAEVESNCYKWTIIQVFKFTYRSSISLELNFKKSPCGIEQFSLNRFTWLNGIVFCFSILSMIIQIKYLLSVKERYQKLRSFYYSKMMQQPRKKVMQGRKQLMKTYTRINTKN